MTTAIIADDSKTLVTVLSELINILDIKILGTANNGKEAAELYKKTKPDLVFLDIMMPDYDGIYALKEIRKINPIAKVIVISADVRQKTKDEMDTLKPSAFLYKPFSIENLQKIIEDLSKT